MPTRRTFIQALPTLALAAPIRSYGCAGVPVGFPQQTIKPRVTDEPLSDFLNRTLGHTNWKFDKAHGLHVNLNLGPPVLQITIAIPAQEDGSYCGKIQIFVERALGWEPLADERKKITVRNRIVSFAFPEPGVVTAVQTRIRPIGAAGRLICTADFLNAEKGSPLLTLVSISNVPRQYCSEDRVLAASPEMAIQECEKIKLYRDHYVEPKDESVAYAVKQCYETIEFLEP